MKRLLPLIFSLLCLPLAQAGQLEISFANVEKYTDIDSGRESQKKYTERVLRRMTEFFEEVANTLPEGDTLNITVNNIDLAGDTRFGSIDLWEVRIMTDLYSPWMSFDAKVSRTDGSVPYSAEEKIRDYNYLSRHTFNREFEYERIMIKSWGKELLAKLD